MFLCYNWLSSKHQPSVNSTQPANAIRVGRGHVISATFKSGDYSAHSKIELFPVDEAITKKCTCTVCTDIDNENIHRKIMIVILKNEGYLM